MILCSCVMLIVAIWCWWIPCVVMWWLKPCLFMNVTVLRSMLILNDCSWINDVMWWLCWVSVVIPCWLWVLSVLYVDLRVNKFWGRNFGLGDQNWVFTWNRERKIRVPEPEGLARPCALVARPCASVRQILENFAVLAGTTVPKGARPCQCLDF